MAWRVNPVRLISLPILWAASAPLVAATCDDLSKLSLPDTIVSSAAIVPAGTFAPPIGPPLRNLPEFCRVVLLLTPSSDSHIEAEVWLPATGWTGKFQAAGNGG